MVARVARVDRVVRAAGDGGAAFESVVGDLTPSWLIRLLGVKLERVDVACSLEGEGRSSLRSF